MEKKYISSSRYKKTIKSKKNKRRVQSISQKLMQRDSMSVYNENIDVGIKKTKRSNNLKFKMPKISLKYIIVLVLILVLIALVILRIILKDDEGFWDFLIENNNNLKSEYSIVINSSSNLLEENHNNLAIVELQGLTGDSFIQINKDYSITYNILEKIEKISNTVYKLYIKNEYASKVSCEDIKNTLESYMKETSVYFSNVSNINEITVLNDTTLQITLKNEDPLFIYNLNIPSNSRYKPSILNNVVSYERNKTKLNFKFETDIDNIITAFKEDDIDIFMTGNRSDVSQLGNYSYDMYSYRTGETVFLFGNKESVFFKDKVMRQAIAYSINRASIVQDVYMGNGEVIDLPYIYSSVKYKYDIYSAQNLLLDNGYVLSEGSICKKNDDGTLLKVKLKFLVNKEDTKKVKIAEHIKNDLQNERNSCRYKFKLGRSYCI